MELLSLSATFGRLKRDTLPLSPGLNVIEAANESGKSTWMAFLRVMLYGLNTRDRSPLADKHRYMPWDGSAMQGSMELLVDGRRITVTRDTVRAGIPMGAFSVSYSDTSEPVPGLTSSVLGETLLGVPQDVFERSAFIRQSGISIDQSPALEQRITALITSGEEDSSYTDAAEQLRRQLNRRRYHKTGLLPQLETAIEALEYSLDEVVSLEDALHACESEYSALTEQESYLKHQLELCDAAEHAHQLSRLNDARDALTAAASLRQSAAAHAVSLPSKEELSRIAGDLTAAEAMIGAVESARKRMQECSSAQEQAQQRLAAHPFAPLSPDQAAITHAPEPPRARFPVAAAVLSALFCVSLFPVLHLLLKLSLSLSLGAVLLCSGLSLVIIGLISVQQQKRRIAVMQERQALFKEDLTAYTILYEEAERTRAAFRTAAQAYNALSTDHRRQLERALDPVRRFGSADNAEDARRSIKHALAVHAALQEAEHRQRQAQLRFDLLSETAPQTTSVPDAAPDLSRADAESRLRTVTAASEELQRQIHTIRGRISALGDTPALRSELDHKRTERDMLRKEYDALALALEVMADANTVLQTRFSPALGEKSANIFTKLTRGKYNKVLLDRKMAPSARQSGDTLPHSVTSLSQGAADQLYLAVRLAVCDMVLPQEKCVPIFLDDALVTFDDERMAAALDYLVELSNQRQILLFTCQKREQAYLRAAHPGRYHVVTLS